MYDPFQRGSHPVGVRTLDLFDPARARPLTVECYYPADQSVRGQDLDRATNDTFIPDASMGEGGGATKTQLAVRDAAVARGSFPLILSAHGLAGDRRESSFLSTHLASHGYHVVSADHGGSTFADVQSQLDTTGYQRGAIFQDMVDHRLADVPFLISAAGEAVGASLDAVGVTGASMGGWTALISPSVDARVKAIVPLCPAGGDAPTIRQPGNALRERIRLDWISPAATLFIVGDRDSWLPLYSQFDLMSKVPTGDRKMCILRRADHQHFVDDVEACHGWYRSFTRFMAETDNEPGSAPWAAVAEHIQPYPELMTEVDAHSIVRGLTTLHMDAVLKNNAEAQALRELGGLRNEIRGRSLDAWVVEI